MTSIEKPIFVNENGPIVFFLETVSVQDRRTVRGLIKQHGGEVVHEPLKADILVAEGNSKAVVDFIEAWGTDKVILDTSWIYRSLEEGKTVGRGRSWGGFRKSNRTSNGNVFDLQEEEDEDNQETSEQMPLSPPAVSQSRKPVNEKRPADNSSASRDHQAAYLHAPSNLDAPPQKRRKLKENAETSHVHTPPPQSQASSSSTQIYQTPLPTSSLFSQSTQSVFAAIGQQMLSSPQFIPLLGPALQQIFTQQGNPDPDLVAAQLRDIAQVISVSSQQASQMPRSTTSPIRSPTPRTSKLSSIKSEDEVEPRLSIPSHQQKGKSTSTPLPDDGIQRAYRTLPPSKKHSAKEDSTPPVVIQRTGFFSSLDGSPSMFFIDLNIRNRRDLINNIKKNGGAIVSSMPESDYVVLNKYSAQFSKMIGSVPLDKITVSHEWMDECIRRNEFVAPESYCIEIPSTPKGRKNQTATSSRKKASTQVSRKRHVHSPSR